VVSKLKLVYFADLSTLCGNEAKYQDWFVFGKHQKEFILNTKILRVRLSNLTERNSSPSWKSKNQSVTQLTDVQWEVRKREKGWEQNTSKNIEETWRRTRGFYKIDRQEDRRKGAKFKLERQIDKRVRVQNM
jgi:hypothetical protein